jgi:hypothetical protein
MLHEGIADRAVDAAEQTEATAAILPPLTVDRH